MRILTNKDGQNAVDIVILLLVAVGECSGVDGIDINLATTVCTTLLLCLLMTEITTTNNIKIIGSLCTPS